MFCEQCTSMLRVAGDGVQEQTCDIMMDELEVASNAGCYICVAFMREFARNPRPNPSELFFRWTRQNLEIIDVTALTGPTGPEITRSSLSIFFGLQEIQSQIQNSEAANSQTKDYRPPIHSSDPAAHHLVAEWLRSCVENHPECRQVRKQRYMPPRLLDLTYDKPRLVMTETFTEHQEYATLSHCWGKSPTFMRLSADNHARFLSGFALDELAKTFQDAIVLCKNLGIRFVWIDSLCIRQHGNGSQEDWLRHVAAMSDIYQSALLNIAAERAASSETGLFHKRDILCLDQPIITLNNGRTYSVQAPASMGLSSNLNEAPLQARGWVMQERILSPRIVHFTENQLCWECSHSVDVCERWPEGNPDTTVLTDRAAFGWTTGIAYNRPQPVRSDDPVWSAAGDYFALVGEYTQRHLTFPGADKLPAFGAIAEHFSRRFQARYAAGIFECHLPSALAWCVYKVPPSRSDTDCYRGPSWSWASIDGPVGMACGYHNYLARSSTHVETHSMHVPFAHLKELNITLKDPRNAFGQLTYANIALRAPLVSCHWVPGTNHWGFDLYQGQMFLHIAPTHLEIGLHGFVFDALDDLNGEQEDVVIAILDVIFTSSIAGSSQHMDVIAIILRKLNGDRSAHYKRIGGGKFMMHGYALPQLQALSLEDIVIV
jgi:hypothetical protein